MLFRSKQMYSDMSYMVRDEGGTICPMFNDFIDATGKRAGGYKGDPNGEMMNGFALTQCWVA